MVEEPEVNEREKMLARIREALAVAAPAPGQHGEGASKPAGLPSSADHRRVLPAVSADGAERLSLFRRNCADLRADFRLVKTAEEFGAALKELAGKESWQRVAAHEGELTSAAVRALGLPTLMARGEKNELARCDAGISECDALVAQTGTVVVTSRSAGGRALSVLPSHHVVLARGQQLVPDLPAAFALLRERYGADYPSMISLITGPSRTGDIERILVLGAHGPKKLTIICCEG